MNQCSTGDLRARAFELATLFAGVQDATYMLGIEHFRSRTPELADFVHDRVLKRLRDADRVTLVLGIARDLDSPTDLSAFKTVFDRVKKLRDRIAHAARVEVSGDDEVTLHADLVWTKNRQEHNEQRELTVTRSELDTAVHECHWLRQHVAVLLARQLNATSIETMIDGALRPTSMVSPPGDPADWDGAAFVVSGEQP